MKLEAGSTRDSSIKKEASWNRNPEIFQHQSQTSSSAADGIDSERVAGKTIITLYLYFLVILIEFFIVID